MLVRYRVDELAARCEVSVDTVRSYQARGLLPRPRREGRAAWYSDEHLQRLRRIRELKAQGLTLAMISRILTGGLDASEQALAVALAGPTPGETPPGDGEELLSLDQLSQRTGVSAALLAAIERQGLLVPRSSDEEPVYTAADAEAVSAGLALLEAGVPLSELLALAREHDQAMRAMADRAVELFARYVRDPIRASAGSEAEAVEQTLQALQAMLPAVSTLVAHHFRGRLVDAARARLDPDPHPLGAGPDPEETA